MALTKAQGPFSVGIDDNATATEVTITSAGNVGIGTDAPGALLHLDATSAPALRFTDSATTGVGFDVLAIGDDGYVFNRNTGGNLVLATQATERLRIDSTGNVGIGTNTPSALLTTLGGTATANSVAQSLDLQHGGSGAAGYECEIRMGRPTTANRRVGIRAVGTGNNFTAPELAFDTNEVERLRIDSSGNVGIGMISPSADLEVGGASTVNAVRVSASSGARWLEMTSDANNGLNTIESSGSVATALTFKTASTERVRIDASGNILVANSAKPVSDAEEGILFSGAVPGLSYFTRDGGLCTSFARLNSYGGVVRIVANGNQAGQIGSSGSGKLSFYNGPGTAEHMTIDASGNVGIGTTNPGTALEVADDTASVLTLRANSLRVGKMSVENGLMSFGFDSVAGNTKRLAIDDSGNVGIGTTSPAGLLDLGVSTGQKFLMYASGNIKYGQALETSEYRMFAEDQADITLGHMARSDGTTYTERVRIDSSGNLLVGATSVGNGQDTSGVLINSFNGDYGQARMGRVSTFTGTASPIAFYHNGIYIGGLNTTTTTTSLVASSDERLKENIVDAPSGIVDAIKVRSFDWKADGSHQDYGFIAQELHEVAPFATSHNEDEDAWGVDYASLVPMLVKEIQDLKAEVKFLREGV